MYLFAAASLITGSFSVMISRWIFFKTHIIQFIISRSNISLGRKCSHLQVLYAKPTWNKYHIYLALVFPSSNVSFKCSGINFSNSCGGELNSCCVKSNNGGKSFPVGNFVLGSLNSSKKLCEHPSRGFTLFSGAYAKVLTIKSMASSGVLLRKTFRHWHALICGNLNSE